MSNKDKIIQLLQKNEWVCTTFMYASYIADPRTILAQMHKKGLVESRWCQDPKHDHKGQMKQWKLIANPSDLLPTPTKNESESMKWVREELENRFKPVEKQTNQQLTLI